MDELPPDIVTRLLARTERKGRCRVWTGCCAAGSSPVITIAGRQLMVRRIMYASGHDECPATVPVSTTCTTARCIAPAHMRTWSTAENNQWRRDPAQLRAMRRAWNSSKFSLREIAEKFGVERSVAYNVVHNITFPDPSYVPQHAPVKRVSRFARLNPKLVAEYRRAHARGESMTEMVPRTGVPWATLHNAVHGATWADVPLEACCCTRGRPRKSA